MLENLNHLIPEERRLLLSKKGEQLFRITRHLRDTRTSLGRGAKVAGIQRKQLKSLINEGWYDMDVDDLTRIADAICALPPRRFSLVSTRLEGWRTPSEKLRAQDVKTRKAMLRYFETHPEEEGSERAITFLKSQLDTD